VKRNWHLEKNIIQCLQNLDRAEWAEAASRRTFNAGSVDFILTDPPYLVNYRDRSGRSIAGDGNGRWLQPAFAEMYRLLQDGGFCVSLAFGE